MTKGWCLAVVLATLSGVPTFAEDHFSGTWVADVANSTYLVASPPQATTQTLEAYGNELRIVTWDVSANGRRVYNDARFTFDGIEHALPGSPNKTRPNTVMATKIDEFTYETTVNNTAGKTLILTREFFSQDGKTRTSTITRTYPSGEARTSTILWNRQQPRARPWM